MTHPWSLSTISFMLLIVCGRTVLGGQPIADARLVLWLDAGDLRAAGEELQPDNGSPERPVARWCDKSAYRNHAEQTVAAQRPTWCANSDNGKAPTVRFLASQRQFLSAGNSASLQLTQTTAFVAARAATDSGNMWLFGKNSWGPPWTGYGLAVSRDGLHPWPHFGLGRDRAAKGVQLQHRQSLGAQLAIAEVNYDGQQLSVWLNGQRDRGVAVRAEILANPLNLLIGAGPQTEPPCEYLQGEIAEILIYDRVLNADERATVRQYLSDKYQVPLADEAAVGNGVSDDRLPMSAEDATPVTRTRTPTEATAALHRDWLFQASGQPLVQRAQSEIDRARQVGQRLADRDMSQLCGADLAELAQLEQALQEAEREAADEAAAERLYLAVRSVKRRMMLRDPAIDFHKVLLIDVPFPEGSEWPHEALHHLGKRAATGGRLLVLDGLHPGGTLQRLMPDQTGAFLRPDLSFDGQRVLFCFKPDTDKTYHLYEVNVDGSGPRQLTSGLYDDISPLYLPDGHIAFCTTRGNSYVRCGPYIESTILARCDADGHNIYLLSAGNEPDYTPTLLPDGRLLYTRWEYTDKEQIRVQSLWTVNPDGTDVSVYWGNQSYWPDILFEARPIPGSQAAMFSGVGHHDVFHGSIGIVDRNQGLNYPDGLTKVTPDVPWGEVGDGPSERPASRDYEAAGTYVAYRCPYPLSDQLFLVSARRGVRSAREADPAETRHFNLYLMDLQGNRELIYEGAYNVFYALPLRPRAVPDTIPDRVAWPGREQDGRPVTPGVLMSGDVYAGLPDVPRGMARYLRVIQQDSTTFSLGYKAQQPGDTVTQPQMLGGPPLSLTVVDGIKRILGTVPIEADGSVCLEVPPCRALHFQLLDEQHRAIQTMRSFANVMPGEHRGCVGCHEMHSVATATSAATALRKPPQRLVPPPWGADYTLAYERDIQPILDRYCGECHQGRGQGRSQYDLTLRAGAGIFREPYVTLVLGRLDNPSSFLWPPAGGPGGIAGTLIPAAMPPATMLKTVPPLTSLSRTSPLTTVYASRAHYDVQLDTLSTLKLCAWIDLLCPYRGEREVRTMPDPDPGPFLAEHWPIVPRMCSAPVVNREYQQDEYSCQEDRLHKDSQGNYLPPVLFRDGVRILRASVDRSP